MKASEIKKRLVADLTPFFVEHGYHKNPQTGAVASYRQEIEGGYRAVIIHSQTVHYGTELWIVYGIRFHAVEALMERLKQAAEFSTPVSPTDISLGSTWYDTIRDGVLRTGIPEIYDGETYSLALDAVRKEFLNYGLGFLSWVKSVRQIDAIINGEPFWDDPTGYSPNWIKFSSGAEWEFSFGGSFWVKRLAIAKVAGNPAFERVVRLNIEGINARRARSRNSERLAADDMTHPVPRAAAFLRALGDDWPP